MESHNPSVLPACLLLILVGAVCVASFNAGHAQNVRVAAQEHFMAPNAAELEGKAAEEVYAKLRGAMTAAYRMSDHASTQSYQDWDRYNTSPYRSATHGKRFVNNFANKLAKAYGKYEGSGPLPQGSLLAKDSFTVTKEGRVSPGPLFLMEKMNKGFKPASGDWKYTMIMPDGSFFGETNGEGADQVEFCITCHQAAAKNDHLFYLPEKYRK